MLTPTKPSSSRAGRRILDCLSKTVSNLSRSCVQHAENGLRGRRRVGSDRGCRWILCASVSVAVVRGVVMTSTRRTTGAFDVVFEGGEGLFCLYRMRKAGLKFYLKFVLADPGRIDAFRYSVAV